jgi:hypothetical protein
MSMMDWNGYSTRVLDAYRQVDGVRKVGDGNV